MNLIDERFLNTMRLRQDLDRQFLDALYLPESVLMNRSTYTRNEVVAKRDMSMDLFREIEQRLEENVVIPTVRKVFESLYALKHEQFRFPKSKKKRIRKKWAKNPQNFRDVSLCFEGPDFIITHHN